MPIFPFLICSSTFFGAFCLTSHRSCRRVNNNRKVLTKSSEHIIRERNLPRSIIKWTHECATFYSIVSAQSSAKKDSSQKLREQCLNRAELYFLLSRQSREPRNRAHKNERRNFKHHKLPEYFTFTFFSSPLCALAMSHSRGSVQWITHNMK